jgi:hypothetical protein
MRRNKDGIHIPFCEGQGDDETVPFAPEPGMGEYVVSNWVMPLLSRPHRHAEKTPPLLAGKVSLPPVVRPHVTRFKGSHYASVVTGQKHFGRKA